MRLTPGSRLISVEKTESSQDAVEAENSEEITEDENG